MFLRLGTAWINMARVLRIEDHAELIPPTTYIFFVGELSFPVEAMAREKLLHWLEDGLAPTRLPLDELMPNAPLNTFAT